MALEFLGLATFGVVPRVVGRSTSGSGRGGIRAEETGSGIASEFGSNQERGIDQGRFCFGVHTILSLFEDGTACTLLLSHSNTLCVCLCV